MAGCSSHVSRAKRPVVPAKPAVQGIEHMKGGLDGRVEPPTPEIPRLVGDEAAQAGDIRWLTAGLIGDQSSKNSLLLGRTL